MGEPRETQGVNGIDILARLIDNVQKSVDRGNDDTTKRFEETNKRLGGIETSVGEMKQVDKTLSNGIADVKQGLERLAVRVGILEDARDDARRTREGDNDARKKEREALIRHVGTLETSIQDTKDEVGHAKEEIQKTNASIGQTNEAVGAIVEELGIENRVELGRDPKPGDKPPEPVLGKIERRARSSTIVQAVIALGVIFEVLSRIFWPHAH